MFTSLHHTLSRSGKSQSMITVGFLSKSVLTKNEPNRLVQALSYQKLSSTEEGIKQRKKVITVPNIINLNKQKVQTAVSVNVTNSYIAWTELSSSNEVIDWSIFPMTQNVKKWHISSVYEAVMKIAYFIPKADVYVLEDIKSPHSSQSTNPTVLANLHLMECTISMLLMYLNNQTFNQQELPGDACRHKVFFLKPFVTARFSGTLVGSEKVSAQGVVMDFLNSSGNPSTFDQFSQIKVDADIKNNYLEKQPLERELMCQALLLVMTFMDLVVRERRESVKFFGNLNKMLITDKNYL